MKLYGSHTEKNLKKALQGEALACVKYQIYASLLGNTSKEIENEINLIAHNEKEHFKVWKKILSSDEYYDDIINLLDAIEGEEAECHEMYPEFARVAREEGFDKIANKFEMIANIECNHSWQFRKIIDEIKGLDTSEYRFENGFVCLNCGYFHIGDFAPDECPVCEHPKNYFKKIQ